MKVAYCSDLHLEFKELEVVNDVGADVLILAGDICVGEAIYKWPFYECEADECDSIQLARSIQYLKFFEQCAKEFKHVIYVAGNHEFYHGTHAKILTCLRENLRRVGDNVHFLDMDCVDIDGVRFLGGTLWTSMNNGDPIAMWDAQTCMSDYKVIRVNTNGNYRQLRPMDTFNYHIKCLNYFEIVSMDECPTVVISHHAPSPESISEEYVGNSLNPAYCSDLQHFIASRPNIKFWVHGHIHHKQSYMIDQCNVVANPRGYPGETVHSEFKLETFEVKV